MTSYHIISYSVILNHIMSHHIISYHVILYHIISCHIISYHIIPYHIISYNIISFHIISYHVISPPSYLCFSESFVPALASSANLKYNSFLTIFFFEVINCSKDISSSINCRIVSSIKSNRVYNSTI